MGRVICTALVAALGLGCASSLGPVKMQAGDALDCRDGGIAIIGEETAVISGCTWTGPVSKNLVVLGALGGYALGGGGGAAAGAGGGLLDWFTSLFGGDDAGPLLDGDTDLPPID